MAIILTLAPLGLLLCIDPAVSALGGRDDARAQLMRDESGRQGGVCASEACFARGPV